MHAEEGKNNFKNVNETKTHTRTRTHALLWVGTIPACRLWNKNTSRRGGWEAQQQRGAMSLTERALVNIRFGLVTTQKSRRQLGEGSLPRSLNSTQERAASLGGRRAELSVPRENSVPARTSPTALTPRPETEFVSDHKMGIDYSSHHWLGKNAYCSSGGKVKRKLTFFLGDIKSLGKWDIHTRVLKGHAQFLFVAWRVNLDLYFRAGTPLSIQAKWTAGRELSRSAGQGQGCGGVLFSWEDRTGIGGGPWDPEHWTSCLTRVCVSVYTCVRVCTPLGGLRSAPASPRFDSPDRKVVSGRSGQLKSLPYHSRPRLTQSESGFFFFFQGEWEMYLCTYLSL